MKSDAKWVVGKRMCVRGLGQSSNQGSNVISMAQPDVPAAEIPPKGLKEYLCALCEASSTVYIFHRPDEEELKELSGWACLKDNQRS